MNAFRAMTWTRIAAGIAVVAFLLCALVGTASAWNLVPGKAKPRETQAAPEIDRLGTGGSSPNSVPSLGPNLPNVNPATGNLAMLGGASVGFPDLGGGPIAAPWSSNQQSTTYNMGPKWRTTYHMKLTFPSGTKVIFEDADGVTWGFTKNADGSYTPEPGYNAALVKVALWSRYILTLPDHRQYWFDMNNGRLVNVFARGGAPAFDGVGYDASGRLSTVEVWIKNSQGTYVPTGRTITYTYNAGGRLSAVTDFAGHTVQYTYDGGGRVATVTDPVGLVTTYGYDSSDRVASVTVNGHTTSYVYNADNLIAAVTDPLNYTTTYAYVKHDNSDQVKTCTITDPNSHVTVQEFNIAGQLIKVTDALGHSESFTYDGAGNRATVTNERTQTWSYLYNAYGDVTRVTDPLQNVTEYTWGYNRADDHLMKTITDPLDHVTTFQYDASGNRTRATDANGNATVWAYDSYDRLTSVTDARNNTTTYSYESPYSPAYVTSVRNPLGNVTSYEYDAVGNRTSVTDARGNTTYYTYDGNGRVTQVTNPDTTTRTFTYTCCHLTSATDENGNTTTYDYDDADRLTSVVDAEGNRTQYVYDPAGNLISVTDANNHVTTYTYNENNWPTRIDYPDGTFELFTYYDNGALQSRTDGNGVTTTYDRDDIDRITTIDYPVGVDPTFAYDGESRMTRAQDAVSDTQYKWDSYSGVTKYDQLLGVECRYGTMTTYRSVAYNYDANYNRTSLRDPLGGVTTFTYDADNRMTAVTRGAQTTTFEYNAVGARIHKALPNGAYTTYAFNNRNWLTTLGNYKSDGTLLSSFVYGHDSVGNRTTMTQENGDVTSYMYDDIYRLLSEERRDSGQTLLYRYAYTYDGVGNRLTETNSGVITYTYDSNNKLMQLVGPSGTTTFGYDGNGNMTSMVVPGPVTWNYSYDYENKLIGVSNDAGYSAAYAYAVDGRRVRAEESNAPNPDLWFLYDGVRPLMEGTLAGDTFTTINSYAWEDSGYEDSLVSATIGGENRYYVFDGLGSTRQLLDDAQTVTDTYTYEAFGNSMGSTGSTRNPYRYVGSLGYYQTGSSLMHLGARYYMPEIARFLQADPDPASKDPLLYLYGGSNPVMSVDPAGLQAYDAQYRADIRLVINNLRRCTLRIFRLWITGDMIACACGCAIFEGVTLGGGGLGVIPTCLAGCGIGMSVNTAFAAWNWFRQCARPAVTQYYDARRRLALRHVHRTTPGYDRWDPS